MPSVYGKRMFSIKPNFEGTRCFLCGSIWIHRDRDGHRYGDGGHCMMGHTYMEQYFARIDYEKIQGFRHVN